MALRLDSYAEIGRDARATPQAVLIVILAIVGPSWLGQLGLSRPLTNFGDIVAGAFLWMATIGLTYRLGALLLPKGKLLPSPASFARMQAFASAPSILGVLAAVPWVGVPVAGVGALWSIVCPVAATRQAFGMGRLRATVTSLLPGIAVAVLWFLAEEVEWFVR